MKSFLITIEGLIQGVGFRPFIYRLANELELPGWVNNTNRDVQVYVQTDKEGLKNFIEQIRLKAPPASQIESIEYTETEGRFLKDFRILQSENLSDDITEVSPDIAVCPDCLEDMIRQPRRASYPFLNCTNCGPRFTIIRNLPYDRPRTTMESFRMCPDCLTEYEDVNDRRFHAQPTACNNCGPHYQLAGAEGGMEDPEDTAQIAQKTARLIDSGKIVAVKGLGGFFMACDAGNQEAVTRLRASKEREGKPFAVMFRDVKTVRQYCELDPVEQKELESWRRPILILRNLISGQYTLAGSVSNGFPTTGCMLPYMPFHYLLFERMKTGAIVLTSGNLAEEPILIDNNIAEEILGSVSDAVLTYNRDIYNRCDDSVGMVINDSHRLLRRSRGYVPAPVRTRLETEGIFAAGAELVNCFAMGKGRQVLLSQHIGDLKNYETFEFYTETIERFERLFRFKPERVAHDLHPDYLSTRFAKETGIRSIGIQHHHAHIASVLAEHELDEKVIGVSFDGTGLGDDGKIWGSEFLVCDLVGYQRQSHFKYIPMPGGDRSTSEPWRLAVAFLFGMYGRDLTNLDLPFLRTINPASLDLVIQALEKDINCPESSGAGRLFDAVAAVLNISTVSDFHAEAPMRLEACIQDDPGSYPFDRGSDAIGLEPVFDAILKDIKNGVSTGRISARFHNTVTGIILDTVEGINKGSGIRKIALSGGTFQNRYLSERVENGLKEKGYQVLVPLKIPANDGGIALGQLAIAAKHRQLGLT